MSRSRITQVPTPLGSWICPLSRGYLSSTDHGLVNTDIALLTCTGKLVGGSGDGQPQLDFQLSPSLGVWGDGNWTSGIKMQRGGVAQYFWLSGPPVTLQWAGVGRGKNAQRGPSESSTLRLLIFSTGNCWLNSGVCVGSCMLNAFTDFPQGVSKFL